MNQRMNSQASEISLTPFDVELRERAIWMQKQLSQASTVDVIARWRMGTEVEKMRKTPRKYGTEVIHRLAKELGRGESTIYKWALVARRWSEDGMTQILRRAHDHRVEVTWSAVCAIASARPRLAGDELVDRLVTRRLSARAVSALVKERMAKRATADLRVVRANGPALTQSPPVPPNERAEVS